MNTGFLVTDVGLAAATVASPTGPHIEIASFRVGSGVNYTPTRAQTTLNGSTLYTSSALSVSAIDADTLEVLLVMPPSVGTFQFGEMGLFLTSGELFAICVWDNLQDQVLAAGVQSGTTYKVHARIKLAQAPAICNVSLLITPALLEVANWSLLLPPNQQVMSHNAAIVHQLDNRGNTPLVVKGTGDYWSISTHSERAFVGTIAGGSSGSVLNITPSQSVLSGALASGKAVIQYLDGANRGRIQPLAAAASGSVTTVGSAIIPTTGTAFEVLITPATNAEINDMIDDVVAAIPVVRPTHYQLAVSNGDDRSATVRLTPGTWQVVLDTRGYHPTPPGGVTATQQATVGGTTVNTTLEWNRSGASGHGYLIHASDVAVGELVVVTEADFTMNIANYVANGSVAKGSILSVSKISASDPTPSPAPSPTPTPTPGPAPTPTPK